MHARERMAGFVEDLAEQHGVEHPLQMSVAVTDGVEIVAVRYSSAGDSRSLFFSTDAHALRARYPDDPRVQQLADETRAIVSEPLGDLPGAWQEVPESHIGIVRPGFDELRTFIPRRAAAVTPG